MVISYQFHTIECYLPVIYQYFYCQQFFVVSTGGGLSWLIRPCPVAKALHLAIFHQWGTGGRAKVVSEDGGFQK